MPERSSTARSLAPALQAGPRRAWAGTVAQIRAVAKRVRKTFAHMSMVGLSRLRRSWLPLDLRLKLVFDSGVHWVDPLLVTRVILNESAMILAASREEPGGRLGGQYRGLWKCGQQHPSRWFSGGFTLSGAFAEAAEPLADHHSYEVMQRIVDGGDWRSSAEYALLLEQVLRADFRFTKGCRTPRDVDRYFERLERLARCICVEGFQSQEALGGDPGDEIRILVGPRGELIVYAGGTHRLAAAHLLHVPRVPVVIKAVHGDWLATCLAKHGGPPERAITLGIADVTVGDSREA
jgi:hypothetical protein